MDITKHHWKLFKIIQSKIIYIPLNISSLWHAYDSLLLFKKKKKKQIHTITNRNKRSQTTKTTKQFQHKIIVTYLKQNTNKWKKVKPLQQNVTLGKCFRLLIIQYRKVVNITSLKTWQKSQIVQGSNIPFYTALAAI